MESLAQRKGSDRMLSTFVSRVTRSTLGVGVLAAGAIALAAVGGPAGTGVLTGGVPTAKYMASHPHIDRPEPAAGLYQPNNDQNVRALVAQAQKLPRTLTRPWRNAGPFGGVVFDPSVGPGVEEFLPVGGI